MEKNFKIDGTYIIKAGKSYDLHNYYNFLGMKVKWIPCQLKMLYEPSNRYEPDSKELLPPLTFNFINVNYLEVDLQFMGTCLGRECSHLIDIGYKEPKDRDNDLAILSTEQVTPDEHLMFRIDNDHFIRVHCQKATLIIEPIDHESNHPLSTSKKRLS